MMRYCLLGMAAALFLLTNAANGIEDFLGGDSTEEPVLVFRVIASNTAVTPGDTLLVAISTTIPDGYHLQDIMKLDVDPGGTFALGRSWHSQLQKRTIGTLTYDEFVGEFVVIYELRIRPDAPEGEQRARLVFTYYPCSEQVCFEQGTLERELRVEVGAAATANAEFEPFREMLPTLQAGEVPADDGDGTQPSDDDGPSGKVYVDKYNLVGRPNILFFDADGNELKRIVGYRGEEAFYEEVREVAGGEVETPKERSLPLWLGLALLGGLLAAFSPCVYPMIPITMGYLADQAGQSFRRNLALVLALGVGVVLPFVAIGAFIGGLKDTLYGLTSNAAYVLILDAVLIVLMASMLGAFEIQLPAALRNKAAAGRSAVGIVGAFVIGLVVVPLAFACTAPALGLIIPFIIGKQLGIAVLIMVLFGLGLASPFLAVGIFAGALSALPRAGAWMLGIKKIFALLLLGVIFYISRPLTEAFPHATGMLAGAAFIALAAALGVFRKNLKSVFNRAVGVIALVLGLNFAVGSALVESGSVTAYPLAGVVRYPNVTESAIDWRHDLDAAFDEAKRDGKLVMAYFWGTYCVACTEYDVRVWPKPEAADALEGFVPVKINVDE